MVMHRALTPKENNLSVCSSALSKAGPGLDIVILQANGSVILPVCILNVGTYLVFPSIGVVVFSCFWRAPYIGRAL